MDADFRISDDFRMLQVTPTGSTAPIIFGTGIRDVTARCADTLLLVVKDLEATGADLVACGVEVGGVFMGQAFGVAERVGCRARTPGVVPSPRSLPSPIRTATNCRLASKPVNLRKPPWPPHGELQKVQRED